MLTLEVVAVPFNSLKTPTQLAKLACPPPPPTNHQQEENRIHPNGVHNCSECSNFRLGSQGKCEKLRDGRRLSPLTRTTGSFAIHVGRETREIAVIKRVGTPYSQFATTRKVTSGKKQTSSTSYILKRKSSSYTSTYGKRTNKFEQVQQSRKRVDPTRRQRRLLREEGRVRLGELEASQELSFRKHTQYIHSS